MIASLGLLAVSLFAAAPAAATTYRGRGVHSFDGAVPCPLAGVGTRGSHACNRVVLDVADAEVTIDPAAHRIRFVNAKRYQSRRLLGDVLLSGLGTTAEGEKVPVAVHVFIEKKGNAFYAKPHAHPVGTEKVVSAALDPYEVVVSNGMRDTVVLTQKTALDAIREPGLAARVAQIFIDVKDNLKGQKQDSTKPGYHLADVTVGLGIGPAMKALSRAELVLPAGVQGSGPRSLSDGFNAGSWEIRITALSDLIPRDVVARDLYLFGIEDLPIVQDLKKKGLKKGEVVAFAMKDGKGTLRVGEQRQELTNASDAARSFMEFSFLGAILAHQAEVGLARAHAG